MKAPITKQIKEWKSKAEKWDALEKKISAFYAEPGDDDYDEEADEPDLIDIGEAAASAFGFL